VPVDCHGLKTNRIYKRCWNELAGDANAAEKEPTLCIDDGVLQD